MSPLQEFFKMMFLNNCINYVTKKRKKEERIENSTLLKSGYKLSFQSSHLLMAHYKKTHQTLTHKTRTKAPAKVSRMGILAEQYSQLNAFHLQPLDNDSHEQEVLVVPFTRWTQS